VLQPSLPAMLCALSAPRGTAGVRAPIASRSPSRSAPSQPLRSRALKVSSCGFVGLALFSSRRSRGRALRAEEHPAEVPPGCFFNDWARWVEENMVKELDLEEEVLPEHLQSRATEPSAKRPAKISGRVWNAKSHESPVRRLRFVLVDAGHELQAFNCIAYPSLSRGPQPVLGIDVLSFNKHKRMLFGVDWAPMFPGEDYAQAYIEPHVAALREEHGAIRSDPSGKFYGDGLPEFFSPHMFFSRPTAEESFRPGSEHWQVFQQYSQRYTAALSSSAFADSEAAQQAAKRQGDYDAWHMERDPALPIFKRMFGEAWTEEFASQVLFPGMPDSPSM